MSRFRKRSKKPVRREAGGKADHPETYVGCLGPVIALPAWFTLKLVLARFLDPGLAGVAAYLLGGSLAAGISLGFSRLAQARPSCHHCGHGAKRRDRHCRSCGRPIVRNAELVRHLEAAHCEDRAMVARLFNPQVDSSEIRIEDIPPSLRPGYHGWLAWVLFSFAATFPVMIEGAATEADHIGLVIVTHVIGLFGGAAGGIFVLQRLGSWLARKAERPHPLELLAAIERMAVPGAPGWALDFARELEARRSEDPELDAILSRLRRGSWRDRLVALDGLADRLEAAAPGLLEISRDPDSPSREWAASLLESLARSRSPAVAAIAERGAELVCPGCYHRTGSHELRRGGREVAEHAGCRTCGRVEGLLPTPGEIVLVLDRDATGPSEVRGGDLRVHHRSGDGARVSAGLPDADRIEIVSATDSEVEELAIRCSNSEDERWARVPVTLATAGLDPNTVRILDRTFGGVGRGGSPRAASAPLTPAPVEEERRSRREREVEG